MTGILGTWRLKSSFHEALATGERRHLAGEHPDGYLSYSADGRMYAIITWENRVKPHDLIPTDQERLELYRTMVAYGGTYEVDGDKVVHHVDISWNQSWTGTDQVRFFKLDGNILTIKTALARNAVNGLEGQSVFVWERLR